VENNLCQALKAMFNKILIANRGEIACRVIQTARRFGIQTVAVYSEPDCNARHVRMADEAYLIGPGPASKSYLFGEKIVGVALKTGAEAIHPGYGFLSENSAFAQACRKAGLIFIGPPPEAIEAMGSKSRAKALMEKAGVPLIPGYHGEDQGSATLISEARKIGYPVLLKAAAGGGGRGMRVVENEKEFEAKLKSAKREAKSSFNDDVMLIEKYLLHPRHIEIQIFCDSHGNGVHLFERECSIQRRHQKIIEEAPAPKFDAGLQEKMGSVAIKAAQAIRYEGAGTVEFLVDKAGRFYFMEMNTRLQVEHPVTEGITGEDLVWWQFLVASGEQLPKTQQALSFKGHAIEARIYAEDPDKDFLPAPGRIQRLIQPATDLNVRIDTGIEEGDQITSHYDPLIAKLIVTGEDRATAVRRLRQALGDYQIIGVTTNLEFLRRITRVQGFIDGEINTHFIEQHRKALFPETKPRSDRIFALAALYCLLVQNEASSQSVSKAYSPWAERDGFRLNLICTQTLYFREGQNVILVRAAYHAEGYSLTLPSKQNFLASGHLFKDTLMANLDGQQSKHRVIQEGNQLYIQVLNETISLEIHNPMLSAAEEEETSGHLNAPMPGTVVAVLAKPQDLVKRGAPLLVIEAMKMEHTIEAPVDGQIEAIHYKVGDSVEEGAELVSFVG